MEVRLLIWGTFGGTGFIFFLLVIELLRRLNKGDVAASAALQGARAAAAATGDVKAATASPAAAAEAEATRGLFLLRDFTYEQLHAATKGFCASNLCSSGKRKVFRGELQEGERVAIKCFEDASGYDEEAAEMELEAVCSVPVHPRLLPLLGICTSIESCGVQRMLVFREIANGDLAAALRRSSAATAAAESLKSSSTSSSASSSSSSSSCASAIAGKPLDWITRFKIAIGIAEGVAFLHTRVPPFVHRDLKASSILLDDGFEVRLSSLGRCGAAKHPDELLADICEFGKVLLDLISGLDVSGCDGDAVAQAWLQKTAQLLEQGMSSNVEDEAFLALADPGLVVDEDHIKELMLLASIARACLLPQFLQRQTMQNILGMLQNPALTWQLAKGSKNTKEINSSTSVASQEMEGS